MPRFNCQLAHEYAPSRVRKWPVLVEPKYDGVRVMVHVNQERIRFFTRNDKDIVSLYKFGRLFKEMSLPYEDVIYDGEVCGLTAADFNRVSGQVRQKSGDAQDVWFCLFDVQKPNWAMSARREVIFNRLSKLYGSPHLVGTKPGGAPIFMAPTSMAETDEHVQTIYQQLLGEGHEGAMVKDPTAPYEFKRVWHWMKVKPVLDITAKVVSVHEGLGKHAGRMGYLHCVMDDGIHVDVGGGFDDAERERVWAIWNSPEQSELAGRKLDVGYQNKTETGTLRFPKFLRWRDDIS